MQVQTSYLKHYFRCQRQEWMGIDRLRLDKFMMLARKFAYVTFTSILA